MNDSKRAKFIGPFIGPQNPHTHSGQDLKAVVVIRIPRIDISRVIKFLRLLSITRKKKLKWNSLIEQLNRIHQRKRKKREKTRSFTGIPEWRGFFTQKEDMWSIHSFSVQYQMKRTVKI
jgi:hypothetical protein